MNKLSITEQIKQILDNGNEDVILEKQTNVPLETIVTKQLLVTTIKTNVDEAALSAAFGGDLSVNDGYIYFNYQYSAGAGGNAWTYNNAAVDLADYGITLELNGNTVKVGDTILVYCESNKIKKVYYQSDILVYEGADNESFNYVKVETDNLEAMINVLGYKSVQYSVTAPIFSNSRYKAESFISTGNPQANTILLKPTVKIVYNEYLENIKVNIVVAKVSI